MTDTIVKLRADPILDTYEVIHKGETIGHYWVVLLNRRQMIQCADRSGTKLAVVANQDEACKLIISTAEPTPAPTLNVVTCYVPSAFNAATARELRVEGFVYQFKRRNGNVVSLSYNCELGKYEVTVKGAMGISTTASNVSRTCAIANAIANAEIVAR